MVDILALALSHGLLALAVLRLLLRADLDSEGTDEAAGSRARPGPRRMVVAQVADPEEGDA